MTVWRRGEQEDAGAEPLQASLDPIPRPVLKPLAGETFSYCPFACSGQGGKHEAGRGQMHCSLAGGRVVRAVKGERLCVKFAPLRAC